MIYLNNNTEQQTVYIPKNDGTGSSHKPTKDLEGVDVTISQDITVVRPSSGYYGMSAVTIDASEYGQSNYDEGFDDGYTDGYSSGTSDGEQSIIDTFTSTTITINGQYGSSANPYSSVTVNVAQTGHTDQELQDAYNSGYTSGSTDGYNSGYTSGETHQKSLLVSTAFTENGTYTRENGYSAITVNVPQTGSTNSIISVTGNTWYVLDHYFGTGEQIEITNATFDYSVANGGRHQQLIAGGDGEWVRIGGNGDNLYTSYYGTNKIDVGTIILDDDHILLTNGAFYINDMETPVSTFSPYPLDIFKDTRMVVFANTAIGQDSVCGQTASVGVITIYDENDNVVDKYIPELHDGVVCLHNVISGNYITPSGTGTPTITNTDYSEGYIDGRQDVIDTFNAITATTNGVYGSSAHPLSSITVNVPQTGSSGVKYVEYIETDGSNIVYDTGIKITSNNVKIYLDYMRHSGSTEDYTGLVSQMYNDMLFSYLFFVPGNWNRDIIMPRFGGDNYEVPSLLDTYYETVVSNTGTTINGVDYPHTFSGFQETDEHMYLNAQHHYGSFRRFAIARYYRFAVESGGTLLVDMRPALDENNVPCFYDEVSQTYIYHTGTGTPISGPVLPSPDYQSGYTDGYNEAISDVIDSAETLSVTANGSYATSLIADGYLWDEVVVNVDTASTYSSGYTSGYSSGYTDGYSSGSTDGYSSGHTDGVAEEQAKMSAITFTANTAITLSEGSYSAVTVNVPQTGGTIDLNPAFIDRSITEIVVPTACTKVGRAAFSHCEEARTITIPDTVTFIDVDGFSHCHRVTGITFGNGIKIIGAQAFDHCGDLLSQGETLNNGHIILPDSVEKIRSDAFYDIDNSVTAITFGSGTTNLDDDIIAGTNIQEIYSYALTAPQRLVHIISGTFSSGSTRYEYYTFRGMINSAGTVHYPSGSDYSSWQNDQYLSGWTFVGDL